MLDFDEKTFLGDFVLPNLEGQLFVEYEDAGSAVVSAPLITEESSGHPENTEKKKTGRSNVRRKSLQEKKHQINQRERKRMKEMAR